MPFCALHHFILTTKIFPISIFLKDTWNIIKGIWGDLLILSFFFKGEQIMEMQKMGKQMINFQKNLFENSYHAMNMVFEQTETMMDGFIKQMPMVPENSKKVMGDVLGFYKKSRDDFKKTIDEGFTKMEDIFIPKEK
jgi:hypothetical protein